MTTTGIRPLAEQAWLLLDAISGVNAFDGAVDIPAYDADDEATHPFWDLDDAGRPVDVHAYAVFYPSPGRRDRRTVAPGSTNVAWSFQVTCVGGDRTRALWCVDKVTTALTGHRLQLPGRRGGGLISELADPGPIRIDRDVTPYRHYVPIDFGVYT